jgi:hypothetical protein
VGSPLARRGHLAPAAVTDEQAWIGEQLALLGARPSGPIEVVHARPWSTVLRVPTDGGPMFFKASAPALRHEPAVFAYLARRRPDLVPPPLAINLERGWMLMADAGTVLRELVAREHDVSRWLHVLPAYGQLQLDLADATADLLALGVPDLRLGVLPSRYAALLDDLAGDRSRADDLRRLRSAIPRVTELCATLAGFGIPETIEHDDLNDGAVHVEDGRHRILDWGDACLSHPFFSMSVTLEGVVAWGPDDIEGSVDTTPYRDAYLAAFAGGRDARELGAALELALRLGWVCRAVNDPVPGIERQATWTRLRMFLDGHP